MKTQFSRRELYAMGEPLGESATRVVAGRRIYGAGGGIGGMVNNVVGQVGNSASMVMPQTPYKPGAPDIASGGGGGGEIKMGLYEPPPGSYSGAAPFSNASPAPQSNPTVSPMSQTDAQQGIAGYAQPYVNTMLGATMQNLFDYDASGNATGMKQYNPYSYNPADYVAGFSPLQQQAQQGIANLQAPEQTQQAANYADYAIQGLLGQQYNPQTGGYSKVRNQGLQNYQMGPAERVDSSAVNAGNIQAAQMGPAERVAAQNFGGQSAQDYMSPYMQNVVDIQQREAQRQADIAGTSRGAQAAKSGAFGGSRQAIMDAEAARNLATQKGDIQAQGLQAAYAQAQQQFNADQARQMQAQQANQSAGLTAGQANLNAQQQANVQNEANRLQASGMTAQQALQAALANQQAGLTTGQNNLNALLGVQSLGSGQDLQAQLANQSARQASQNLAAQQQQFGASLGQQGLQSALSGANTLGNLGTTNLNNQLGVLNAQNTAGQQQQQQQQNIINRGVQNYETAQQYPTQQLNQMKNMLSGLPITTTSTQNYQAAPTNLQNIMALGMGGYGLNQMMGGGSGGTSGGGITSLLNGGASGIGNLVSGGADLLGKGWDAVKGYLPFEEGGQVKGYAQGGVTSEENVRSIANFLPTPQLPKSFQMAQGRGDFNAQDALQQEMAERASLQRGLGGAFNQLPQGAQQNVIRAAGGGVVAFGDPALNPEENQVVEGAKDGATEDMDLDNLQLAIGPVNSLQAQAARRALDTARQAGALRYTPTPAREQQELTKSYFNQLESLGGPNPYDPMLQSLQGRRDAISGNMEQAKGLAALRAMKGMLQPGGAMRGLGNAADAIADSMEKAQAAKAAEERSIELMNFNLMDAKRKERSGNAKGAMEATAKAEKNKLDAVNAERAALNAQGGIEAKVAQSLRTTGGGGAGKTPKIAEQNYLNILEDLRATSKPNEGESPKAFEARLAREASKKAVAEAKTSESGPGKLGVSSEANEIKRLKMYEEALGDLKVNKEYVRATPERKREMEAEVRTRVMSQPLPQDDGVVKLARGGNIGPIKLD